MSGFLKKTGQSAKDLAIKAAKRTIQEPVEVLSHTRSQLSGVEAHGTSLVDEIVGSSAEHINPSEEAQIRARERKRIQEIEVELQKMRQERTTRETQWSQGQQTLMSPQEPAGGQKTFVEPAGRHKRGFMGAAGKKGGTKETGKPLTG